MNSPSARRSPRPQLDIFQAMGRKIVDGWPSRMESGFRPPNTSWEAEAKTMLQDQDFMSIQQILRFRLYGEKDSLRHLLLCRSEYWLDQILLGLRPTRVGASHHTGVNLNRDQKVTEILATVEPNRPSSPMGESWAPYRAADETDVKKIAADVAEDSGRQFNAVTFEDWFRSSIGYTEESVEGLLSQHTALSRRLHSYLRRHPSERDKYEKVEKELRNRSTLAWQAFRVCLDSPPHRMPMDRPRFNLGIITGPLRQLFQSRSLVETLAILPMLAIRFDLTYKCLIEEVDWRRPFSTRVDMFDDLMAGHPMKRLAKKATLLDKYELDLLCPAGFKTRGAHLRYLDMKSNAITREYAECLLVHPKLTDLFQELVEELFRLRNWYRFSALLVALREAHFDESTLPSYFDLLDPSDDFTNFRAHMAAQPGLPFLLPYVKRYAVRGEEVVIADVFQFLLYNPEAVLALSGCSRRDN
ncbi:MAG: hypothetical protein Q9217_006116 [Psora testacea]